MEKCPEAVSQEQGHGRSTSHRRPKRVPTLQGRKFAFLLPTLVTLLACDSPAATYDGGGQANQNVFHVIPSVLRITSIGDTLQLQASIKSPTLEPVSPQLVTWVSSDPTVATVTLDGRVISAALGEVVITGRYSGHQATSQVISTSTIETVVIEAMDSALVVGNTLALASKGIDAKGRDVLGASWGWTSSNPAVAAISSLGVVTARSAGDARLTAEALGSSGTFDLQIIEVPVVGMHLNPPSVDLEEGLDVSFQATPVDSVGGVLSRPLTWTVQDTSVATVVDGKLVAAGAGNTTLNVTAGGYSVQGTVRISATPVKTVGVVPAQVSASPGQVLQLATTLRDGQGQPVGARPVTWNSEDPTVATVSDGKVTAITTGSTVITASFASLTTRIPVSVVASGGTPSGGNGGGGDTGGTGGGTGGDTGGGTGDSGGSGGGSTGGGSGGGGGTPGGGGSGGGGTPGGGGGGNTADPGNLAFPGAQGFGARALTSCSRNNVQVLMVTNRNGSGSGSLRSALDQNDPNRLSIVIFRTGGTIPLSYKLRSGCIYVAGQTAPGGGVQLYNNGSAVFVIDRTAAASNIAMRYIRFRSDKGPAGKQDVISITGGHDLIFDHLSVQFGNDEVFSITPVSSSLGGTSAHHITVQRTITAAGLRPHSTGTLIKPPNDLSTSVHSITYHHNLWADNSHRNPRVNGATNLQLINNVVYNWRNKVTQFSDGARVDVISNYYKAGPWSGSGNKIFEHDPNGSLSLLYLSGNVADPWQSSPSANQRNLILYKTLKTPLPSSAFASGRLVNPPVGVSQQSASGAYNSVRGDVGANRRLTCDGNWTGAIDSLDQRILGHVSNGTGPGNDSQADHPSDYGGVPSPSPGSPCADSDNDGMPDAFENRFGLDPNNASDASQDPDNDGYVNIEEYVNGTKPR